MLIASRFRKRFKSATEYMSTSYSPQSLELRWIIMAVPALVYDHDTDPTSSGTWRNTSLTLDEIYNKADTDGRLVFA